MAITMQGTWTVSVKSKSAAFAQRFIIAGASVGNGTYAGAVATPPVFVDGDSWSITTQNDPGTGFIDSQDQITFPTLSAGQYHFDIQSNDAGADQDFNDLVLTCSMPQTATDFLIYGSVSYYGGFCWFNPCSLPWLVIETPAALQQALNNPLIRKALEQVYPERILRFPPPPPPDPLIDRPRFKPLALPLREATALPPQLAQVYRARDDAKPQKKATGARDVETMAVPVRTFAPDRPSAAAVDIDRVGLAGLIDRIRLRCETGALPGVVLGFQQYDRSNAELAGGPYTGAGPKQPLGICATDRNGNYIFRFTWSFAQVVNEAFSDVASGENIFTQILPDVIAQYLDFGKSTAPCYESAPYWNIANLQRINLCVPKDCIGRIPTACQGHNAIQSVGNIFIGDVPGTYAPPAGAPPGYGPRVGFNNFLGEAGRITAKNTLPDVPQASCAAWVGYLDLFACFLDHPEVKYYTIRHRPHQLPFLDWKFFTESYIHPLIAHLGLPNYSGDLVGPQSGVNLGIDGGPLVPAPAYLNIESDPAWVFTHRDRKAVMSSWIYAATPGPVDFRIEGYDVAGARVAAADDTITLDIDNSNPDYFIQSVSLMGSTVTPCSLITLPAGHEHDPITVQYKAEQPQGFMNAYALAVVRCNPGLATERKAGGQTSGAYVHGDDLNCSQFFGTPDDPAANGAGVVTVDVGPVAGQNWLNAGQPFGIFTVSLDCSTRVTNGYNTATRYYGPTSVTFALQS